MRNIHVFVARFAYNMNMQVRPCIARIQTICSPLSIPASPIPGLGFGLCCQLRSPVPCPPFLASAGGASSATFTSASATSFLPAI